MNRKLERFQEALQELCVDHGVVLEARVVEHGSLPFAEMVARDSGTDTGYATYVELEPED